MPDAGPLAPDAFDVGFGIVLTIVIVLFALVIGTAVYRSVRLARRGVNPLTLQEDLATRALRSEALVPARSKADRLDELELLHTSGRISDAEHAAARARLLAE